MPELVGRVVPEGRLRRQEQPTLAVDELILRPWLPRDAEAVVAAYRDPDIRRWHVRSMSHAEAVLWVEAQTALWRTESGAGWAITDRDQVVGRVGLRTADLKEGLGEVAYWVLPVARGRGVAPRALRAVTEWMFEHVGLHRISLLHSTENETSCRVAAKAGYAFEGIMRQQGLHADGWHDMHLHACLRTSPAER